MRTTPRRLSMISMALCLTLGLVASACGDDTKDSSSTTAAGSATTAASAKVDYEKLSGQLNGGGSSFQDALEQAVKTAFATDAPNVTVNYAKSGSGQGKQDLANQVVQFAGTDSLVKPEEKAGFKGGDVLYFPIAAAPITVTANVKGLKNLVLDAETVAGIFGGTITSWDDAKIKATNPKATLPATKIVVVHRSDKSGTTSNFTKYLAAAAPTTWTLGSGDEIQWPATTQGAEKNSGVATLVSSTDGAVGYIDLADAVAAQEKAPGLVLASIKNKAGKTVDPKLPGATAALEGTTVADDLTFNPLNAAGDAAYPITAPTWILVYKTQPDATVGAALKGYLTFFLTKGQDLAEVNGYAPLPKALAAKALAQVDSITAG